MTSEERALKFYTEDVSLPRSGYWHVMISMEFLRPFLRGHFAGKPVVASRNFGCFLRLTLAMQWAKCIGLLVTHGLANV